MSAILKFDFQKRKQLRFSELKYINYTKKTQFCMWQLNFPKTRGNKNKQWTHSTPLKVLVYNVFKSATYSNDFIYIELFIDH